MSGLKTGLGYIKDSFSQIIKGFILFILVTSGLGFAILLRFLGFNGSTIVSVGISLEAICLILSYLLLRKYVKLKEEESSKKQERKGKVK
ncbi:MAG: hypothetical protein ACFE8G_01960 [Candidatus Hermodarchaeota archaeon]